MKKTVARKDSVVELDLTQEEVDIMKEQFHIQDRQKQGFINIFEINSLFEGVGEFPSQENLQQVQSWAEEKAGSRKLDVNLALRA